MYALCRCGMTFVASLVSLLRLVMLTTLSAIHESVPFCSSSYIAIHDLLDGLCLPLPISLP